MVHFEGPGLNGAARAARKKDDLEKRAQAEYRRWLKTEDGKRFAASMRSERLKSRQRAKGRR